MTPKGKQANTEKKEHIFKTHQTKQTKEGRQNKPAKKKKKKRSYTNLMRQSLFQITFRTTTLLGGLTTLQAATTLGAMATKILVLAT